MNEMAPIAISKEEGATRLARVFADGHANIRIWINEYNATLA